MQNRERFNISRIAIEHPRLTVAFWIALCICGWMAFRTLKYALLPDITFPVVSEATSIDEILIELEQTKVPERAGRALDHETEDAFERLRVAGYL